MNFPDPKKYFLAAQELNAWLDACKICPRMCGANRRYDQAGYCGAGTLALVNTWQLHHGEEPSISGSQGSGTVFFSGCTMRCIYCQNHQISRGQDKATPMGALELAQVFMDLQAAGAHNINLVTPTPHLVVILKALTLARDMGLSLPIVYNTSGFERMDTLKILDGLIEIYLPDFKYLDEDYAASLSDAEEYPLVARQALKEMLRQVGHLQLDENGVARSGLLVRHLVLPDGYSDSPALLAKLAKTLSKDVWVSLMAQYTPMHEALAVEGLDRPLTQDEYQAAKAALTKSGITNGYVQELSASGKEQIPRFASDKEL